MKASVIMVLSALQKVATDNFGVVYVVMFEFLLFEVINIIIYTT
jgi:hypothetical protein